MIDASWAEKVLSQYGFGVLLSIILAIIFFFVLKWIAKRLDKTFAAADAREARLMKIIDDYSAALNKHTESAQKFYDRVQVAQDRQRREHEEHTRKISDLCDIHEKSVETINNLVTVTEGLKVATLAALKSQ